MSATLQLFSEFKVTHGAQISGKNYYQISPCDGVDIGSWSGSPTLDNDTYVEGSGAYSETMKTAGNNDMTFTPAAALNLTNVHLRLWILDIHGGTLQTRPNGGIQFMVSDGANTGYWYVGGRDEYPGGWYQLIQDTRQNVDAGTKPDLTAITTLGFRLVLTGGKNFENIWWDDFAWCDGLIVAGDDAGDPWSFDSVAAIDFSTAGRWGILQPFQGVNYLTGSLDVGDTVGNYSTLFKATNEVVVYQDKSAYVLSTLYAITVVGHASRYTSFQLGEKLGAAGISGCFVRCNAASLAFEITCTDTNVDVFKIYASVFGTYGTIDGPLANANYEILDSTFNNGIGQIQPNTMNFDGNTIIASVFATGALLMESIAHGMDNNVYVGNIYGIEINTIGTYPIRGDQFSGSIIADINNTSGGLVTINASGSNVSTYTNNTVIVNTVYITIECVDQTGAAVAGARVAVYLTSTNAELMNELTTALGIATEPYNYGGTPVDIYFRVRKSSSPGLRYIPYESSGEIDDGGFTTTVTMVDDDIAL